jgi:hypothetical protein
MNEARTVRGEALVNSLSMGLLSGLVDAGKLK